MFPPFLEMPLTYAITGLFILISIIGFYYKPLYNALIFHPYEVFRGKRMHTIFTSAFVHTGWKHLAINIYLFYTINRDIEYIIMEKDYNVAVIKCIYLIILLCGVIISNLIIGWEKRLDISFTAVGLSAGVFTFMGFAMLYLPLDHPKRHYKLIPLYYGYEFALALFIVLLLLMIIFKKSKTNHKAHFLGLMIGFVLAAVFRPKLISELINHIIKK